MIEIKSLANETFKKAKKLREKKYRLQYQELLVEGPLVLEEISDQEVIKALFVHEERKEKLFLDYPRLFSKNIPTYIFKKNLFQDLQATKESQGLVGLVESPVSFLEGQVLKGRYLYTDGIQDPGNMGGLIRSCEAFSFDGILLGPGSVDVTNPKVIRSSMASAFRLKLYSINDGDLERLLVWGQKLLTLDLDGKNNFKSKVGMRDLILVVGNEARGPRDYIRRLSSEILTIPVSDKVNSLNANVAASIAMYLLQGGE